MTQDERDERDERMSALLRHMDWDGLPDCYICQDSNKPLKYTFCDENAYDGQRYVCAECMDEAIEADKVKHPKRYTR